MSYWVSGSLVLIPMNPRNSNNSIMGEIVFCRLYLLMVSSTAIPIIIKSRGLMKRIWREGAIPRILIAAVAIKIVVKTKEKIFRKLMIWRLLIYIFLFLKYKEKSLYMLIRYKLTKKVPIAN